MTLSDMILKTSKELDEEKKRSEMVPIKPLPPEPRKIKESQER